MTKTRPTTAKLPKAKVNPRLARALAVEGDIQDGFIRDCIWTLENDRRELYGPREDAVVIPVAIIPPDTSLPKREQLAQARAICKAAPFLRMTEGEKRAVIALAAADPCDPISAILSAMGLGGGK